MHDFDLPTFALATTDEVYIAATAFAQPSGKYVKYEAASAGVTSKDDYHIRFFTPLPGASGEAS